MNSPVSFTSNAGRQLYSVAYRMKEKAVEKNDPQAEGLAKIAHDTLTEFRNNPDFKRLSTTPMQFEDYELPLYTEIPKRELVSAVDNFIKKGVQGELDKKDLHGVKGQKMSWLELTTTMLSSSITDFSVYPKPGEGDMFKNDVGVGDRLAHASNDVAEVAKNNISPRLVATALAGLVTLGLGGVGVSQYMKNRPEPLPPPVVMPEQAPVSGEPTAPTPVQPSDITVSDYSDLNNPSMPGQAPEVTDWGFDPVPNNVSPDVKQMIEQSRDNALQKGLSRGATAPTIPVTTPQEMLQVAQRNCDQMSPGSTPVFGNPVDGRIAVYCGI